MTYIYLLIALTASVSTATGLRTTDKEEMDRPTYEKANYAPEVKTNLRGGSRATWDFETGLQGWTHTNGLAFPEAWAVQPSGLHGSYTPPAAGDSSMWIDSDACGSGSTVHDTALSPILIPSTPTTDWLWYGFGFNNLGSDFLEVGIKYFDGSTWTVVPLRTYAADTVGADSIDVSAYNTYQWIQVYFYYDAPGWDWYAAFDNVTIDATIYVPDHDVGVATIDEPGDKINPYTLFTPTATYENFGSNPETFDAYYRIDSAGSTIYSQTVSLALNPGDDSTYMFPGYISGGIGATYDIFAYTVLTGDENPNNDTLTQVTVVNAWQIVTNMPQTLMDHAVVFDGNDIYVLGGYNGSSSLDSVFIYSASKGTWSTGASMPADICMFDACVLGDTIYVPGGYSYGTGAIFDNLYKYSISGNDWTTSAGTGEPAWFYTCAAANGKVYKIGGLDEATSTLWASTWEYTPGAGWTKKTDMSTACELSVKWVKNDTIYIAGGHDGVSSPRNVTQFYDPVGDVWTQDNAQFAYLPKTLWGAGSALYKDTLYVMAGIYNGLVSDSVFYYDDVANAWVPYPTLIQGVYRTDGIGVEGVGAGFDGIYLFGGSTGGFIPITDVQASKILPSGVDEYTKEEAKSYLSVPMSIGRSEIRFTYNGEVSRNIIVVDITGRIVDRYDNVRPGTALRFGRNGISSGIYFISVEGSRRSSKVTLIR